MPVTKDDLMQAALIVEAFAQDTIGGRPDLRALALRLREAAPQAEQGLRPGEMVLIYPCRCRVCSNTVPAREGLCGECRARGCE